MVVIVDCVGEPIFGCTWEGPRIERSTSCLRSLLVCVAGVAETMYGLQFALPDDLLAWSFPNPLCS